MVISVLLLFVFLLEWNDLGSSPGHAVCGKIIKYVGKKNLLVCGVLQLIDARGLQGVMYWLFYWERISQ